MSINTVPYTITTLTCIKGSHLKENVHMFDASDFLAELTPGLMGEQ